MSIEAETINLRPNIKFIVQREQAALLLRGLITSLIANCFIACSLSVILETKLPIDLILSWLGLILLLNSIRFAAIKWALRANLVEQKPGFVLTTSWLSALLCGGLWASLLIVIDLYDLNLSPAIAFVVCGISAGSVIQGTPHRATVWAFIIPVVGVHVICLLTERAMGASILAANVGLFLWMMCRRSAFAERQFLDVYRLKYEATDLASSLKQASRTAETAVTQLKYLANHDTLTGLANRSGFNDAVAVAIEDAKRNRLEVALLLIDLDRFKSINDTYGHAAGDMVLSEVARRLNYCVGGDHIIARLGGDEFAIVLWRDKVDAAARHLAEELIHSLSRSTMIGGRQLSISASIGYSLFPNNGLNLDELQINADVALYAAKSMGRAAFRGFDEELQEATNARRNFELDLPEALVNSRLEVWFQPQVSITSRKLVGLESLIRWNHPQHGWVSPPQIVAAALDARQSEALTRFVLTESCRMIKALSLADYGDVTVSFNVSPKELSFYSLAALITSTAQLEQVSIDRLEVEITEEAMFADERSQASFKAVSDIGVKIAIDDFGVAYSSFGALQNSYFDCIKIDRVFIERLTARRGSRALVKAILAVARALGVRAIAEGVETAEQAAVLASLGCREAQGYFFAKPMPAAQVFEWLTAEFDAMESSMPAANKTFSIQPMSGDYIASGHQKR